MEGEEQQPAAAPEAELQQRQGEEPVEAAPEELEHHQV